MKTCATNPELCPTMVSTGSVAGRVCAADGHTWLSGALVYVIHGDKRLSTHSEADGRYLLKDVPAGSQTLHIEKGSFSVTKQVTVQAGTFTQIPEDACQLDVAPRVAVVHGSQYDRVEGVLAELGVQTDALKIYSDDWAEQLLADDRALDAYDILFLNCRSNEATFNARPDMQQRLRNFVQRGGKLHASDQAYGIIELAFPTKIDFFGDDATRQAANQGNIVDLNAQVVDLTLAQGLGHDTVRLHYGLTTWSVMVSVASDVHVYVKGTSPLLNGMVVSNAPQLVGFDFGQGHVVYSSFHQEPGIGADQEKILKLVMFEL